VLTTFKKAKSTMNKITCGLLIAFATSVSTMFAAAEQQSNHRDIFPDTPANRTLVAKAYDQYLSINKNHGRFVDVNGIKMHYLEWGDEKGIPLIWSHGSGSTGFELVNVAEQLVDAGYHVYAITYRGHGQTKVTDYQFSLSHIADDIAAMMDHLGIEKAVIGGLSLGGGVTTTFYENYPQRSLALVLEDGGADRMQIRYEKSHDLLKKLTPSIAKRKAPSVTDRFTGFQYTVRLFMHGWHGEFPAAIAPAFHSFIVSTDDGSFVAHYQAEKLMGTGAVINHPAESFKLPLLAQSWRRIHPIITYRNLQVPMLIIDPTGDAFNPTVDFEMLRDMHPKLIDVVEYPNTPHAAHPVRPEWFVRDMKKLLVRLRNTATTGR
jgi:pimeloyl-ACP methyl ester carboxylesterase